MKYTSHVVRPLCTRSEQEPNNCLHRLNYEPQFYKKKKVIKSIEIQLNKYETAPNFIQLTQNLTWDCLLI